MEHLRQHAWKLLLGMTASIAVIGIRPLRLGIDEDPSVPLGFAGMTADELKADNAQSYRLIDVQARFAGIDLVVIGTLLSAVLVGAFRQNQRWSWWTMWLLPLWGTSVFIAILRSGMAAKQTPPSPFFTGPIVAVLSSALLVVTAPQFFGHSAVRGR